MGGVVMGTARYVLGAGAIGAAFTICALAIKNAFNERYPEIPWQCGDCHARLKSRDPIELNRAIGEHMTAHAAASGPIWNGRKP